MSPSPLGVALQLPVQSSSPLEVLLLVLAVVAVIVLGGLFGAVRLAMIQGTGQSDGPSPEELTNCPSCGARTPVDAASCDYCGDPVAADR